MRTLVLAHRGAPWEGPDNSLGAFKALATLGVDGVELDVQSTADGVPVVVHDVSVGGRRVESLTYGALRELQGELVSEDARVPMLEEVLRVIPDDFLVNLELKSPEAGPSLISAISGAHSRYRLVVTSFDGAPLVTLRQHAPEVRTGLVAGIPVADLLGRVRESLADVISLQWRLVTRELIDQMHDNGVAVYAWTVNSGAVTERMLELGVDAMITDDPELTVPVVDRVQPRGPAAAML